MPPAAHRGRAGQQTLFWSSTPGAAAMPKSSCKITRFIHCRIAAGIRKRRLQAGLTQQLAPEYSLAAANERVSEHPDFETNDVG
jgi:hypothetical protein